MMTYNARFGAMHPAMRRRRGATRLGATTVTSAVQMALSMLKSFGGNAAAAKNALTSAGMEPSMAENVINSALAIITAASGAVDGGTAPAGTQPAPAPPARPAMTLTPLMAVGIGVAGVGAMVLLSKLL